MGLPKHKENLNSTISDLLEAVFKKGIVEGYDRGYDDGYKDGYEQRMNEDKPAISEGLRKGSPQCGKAMRRMKNEKQKSICDTNRHNFDFTQS